MKQSVEAIGKNLKRLRQRRNLSFEQLSQQTGVSKSMIRQIEIGKSNPTVSTIWKIANGLHLSFSSLLQNSAIEGSVRKFTDAKPLFGEAQHYRVYPLVSFDPLKPFEMYYFELDSKTEFEAEPHGGGVSEYLFLFSGGITVKVDKQLFQVKTGHFLQFSADSSHSYLSSSNEVSSGIMVLSYSGL